MKDDWLVFVDAHDGVDRGQLRTLARVVGDHEADPGNHHRFTGEASLVPVEFVAKLAQRVVELDRTSTHDVVGLGECTEGGTQRLHRGRALATEVGLPAVLVQERPGDAEGVSVSFKGLANEVAPGATILLDDGAMELRVQSVINDAIHCQVVHGGTLRSRKSVNLPDTRLSISLVGPENREDVIRELSFASENEVEYIAASFVQSADDIVKMREILTERNVEIPIIAKIENKAGVANLDEIIKAADGLMVARGDLGVEIPIEEIAAVDGIDMLFIGPKMLRDILSISDRCTDNAVSAN